MGCNPRFTCYTPSYYFVISQASFSSHMPLFKHTSVAHVHLLSPLLMGIFPSLDHRLVCVILCLLVTRLVLFSLEFALMAPFSILYPVFCWPILLLLSKNLLVSLGSFSWVVWSHFFSRIRHEFLFLLFGNLWLNAGAFKLKRKSDESIKKYKAHLIAKGFHQQRSIDFDETFSPMVKPTTVWNLLTLVRLFINWMWRMHFFMVIWTLLFLYLSLQGLLIQFAQLMYVNFIESFMV